MASVRQAGRAHCYHGATCCPPAYWPPVRHATSKLRETVRVCLAPVGMPFTPQRLGAGLLVFFLPRLSFLSYTFSLQISRLCCFLFLPKVDSCSSFFFFSFPCLMAHDSALRLTWIASLADKNGRWDSMTNSLHIVTETDGLAHSALHDWHGVTTGVGSSFVWFIFFLSFLLWIYRLVPRALGSTICRTRV